VKTAPLDQRTFGDPKHEFWADGIDVPSSLEDFHLRSQGHRHWTDAYLLSLARSRKGVFTTFDRSVRTLAGQSFASALEVIPAR
jgi:predicted nucleic acid-binding protein